MRGGKHGAHLLGGQFGGRLERLGLAASSWGIIDPGKDDLDDILRAVWWLPEWVALLIILAIAAAAAFPVHWLIYKVLKPLVAERDLFWRSLVARSEGPARLGLLMLFLAIAAQITPLSRDAASVLSQIFFIAFVILVAWLSHSAMHIFTVVYLRRFKLDAEDNHLARKHTTQVRILTRVADILIIVLAVSIALMTFDGVRQYGVSLLASAGAAGLIIGLALQSVFKNLFAGIQIAITQPIRIDDAVIVEGEWGNIEEITSTYVVIRIWDWRRLIVPISYFIEQPFQNWTRDGAALIGTVMIYLDYNAPLEKIRAKAKQITENSPLWDKNVFVMQVTDFRERVMEVRFLASAKSSPIVYDLRCEIREKLITYIQHECPEALPRTRAIVDSEIPEVVLERAAKGIYHDQPAQGATTPKASR